jgi:hypothetical protein
MLNENVMIAEIILKQLGGSRFVAMTGAKDFLAVDRGLMFRIPRTRNIRKVIITLRSDDTYNVEFIAIRNLDAKVVKKLDGLFCDQLQSEFTKITGLDTHI